MTVLDRLIGRPGLVEMDHVDVVVPVPQAWDAIRHLDLAASPLSRALVILRTLPNRLVGEHVDVHVRFDDLVSSPAKPGFQIFVEDPPRELAAGAIGKVWRLRIPFVHVPDVETFAAFAEPDFIKVAWAIRVVPLGEQHARVEIEVRVQATDAAAWRKFRRYFRLIGPGSHLIRRTALAHIARELGTRASDEESHAATHHEPHAEHVGHGGSSC
jgi:hypothetical protein